VQEALRRAEAELCALPLHLDQRRALWRITRCRTAALGGHLYRCDDCEGFVPLYNSCLDRHCPTCQAAAQARWVSEREARTLPVGHFHLVVALPSELRAWCRRFPRALLGLFFRVVSSVLTDLARQRLDARLAVMAVLHTWTRELMVHPHLHVVVSGGGLSMDDERWVATGERHLFPGARAAAHGAGALPRGGP